jgi:uncharacterized protein (TIGR02444 family)
MRRADGDDGAAGEALWRFSLALYARPGVAPALLALQDRAAGDVNLILYGLWLGASRGRVIVAVELKAARAAAAPIAAEVVEKLRRLRRELRRAAAGDLQALRRQILALELAAERRVQYRLAAIVPEAPPQPDRLRAAEANLAAVLGAEAASDEARIVCRELAQLTRSGEGATVASPG